MDPVALAIALVGALAILGAGFGLPAKLAARARSDRDPGATRREIAGFRRAMWWLNRLYCAAVHRLTIANPCPLPKSGGAILIANHTCGVDHMLLQATTDRLLGFMMAREFFDPWWSRPFCLMVGAIPVERNGRDLAATREALRVLAEGRVLPIFPEGRINPDSGRTLIEGKPGAAFLAARARVPVIPAHIFGTPPTNELGPSMTTSSETRIRFGPPIQLDDIPERPDRETLEAITDRFMKALDALRREALEEAGIDPDHPHGENRDRDPRQTDDAPHDPATATATARLSGA